MTTRDAGTRAGLPGRPEMVRLIAEQQGISLEQADAMLRRAVIAAKAIVASRVAAPIDGDPQQEKGT